MTRKIDIGGNQGRGNPELGRNRLAEDGMLRDPDSEWQDSAQAMLYVSNSPRVPRDRSPLSWGSLVAAVVIVGLCAGTVLVACSALGAA